VADPAVLLALVMLSSLTAYALLGGADYGGGVWDLLATGPSADDQRATISRVLAPVWEANHVWLILVVTVLFNAFPAAFAWISVALHVPLLLMLLGIVMRGSAFVFRAYGPKSERHVRGWGWVFASASIVTPVLLGTIVGAITEGQSGGAVAVWLTPFTLAVGLFALVLFAYLAAVYLTLEATEAAVADAFRARALAAGVLAGVLALSVLLLARGAPHLVTGLTRSAWALPLHVATAACALGALAALWRRHFWWARTAAIAQVTLIVWGWGLAQYPYLVRPHLSIQSTAAPRPVLVLLLQILVAGAIVLIPSLVYLFRIFSPSTDNRIESVRRG
jgi:cytochrome d ubiquinol oxidase subunit II